MEQDTNIFFILKVKYKMTNAKETDFIFRVTTGDFILLLVKKN